MTDTVRFVSSSDFKKAESEILMSKLFVVIPRAKKNRLLLYDQGLQMSRVYTVYNSSHKSWIVTVTLHTQIEVKRLITWSTISRRQFT